MTNASCHPDRPDYVSDLCAECVHEILQEREDGRRVCPGCYERKAETEFHRGASQCKGCVRLRVYGLKPEGYRILLEEQGRACAICRAPEEERGLEVDHDHNGGGVRGLLCGQCNRALGLFDDDAEVVRRAADYLVHPPVAASADFNMGGCGCFPGSDWSVGQVLPD